MRTERKKHSVSKMDEIERQKKTKAWLVSSALEGIYPDTIAQDEIKLLDSGRMTPQQFEAYIISKYRKAE